jgi:hypothetical protein
VLRLCWSYSLDEEQSSSADWRCSALILGTLFLNFPFWFAQCGQIGMDVPIVSYAAILALFSLTIAVCLLIAPAVSVQRARVPLFSAVALSLGSVPAVLIRACSLVFLVIWMAGLSSVLGFVFSKRGEAFEDTCTAAAVVGFLFITALAGPKTSARQARFATRLGIAILLAAFLRVHEGWSAIPHGFSNVGLRYLPRGASAVAFSIAPVVFLGGTLLQSMPARKDLMKAAGWGIAGPLWGTLFLVSVIHVAAYALPYYTLRLDPILGMVLRGNTALSALPGRMLIAVTIFGPMRFGAKTLQDVIAIRELRPGWKWLPASAFVLIIAWFSGGGGPWAYASFAFEIASAGLIVAAAILTADALVPVRRIKTPLVDIAGVAALFAGLATFVWVQRTTPDGWWDPGLLPSYGTAFAVALLGRATQRLTSTPLALYI